MLSEKGTSNLSIDTSGICGIVGDVSRKDDLMKMGNGMRVARHAPKREIYVDDPVGLFSVTSRGDGHRVVKNEKETIVAAISGEICNAAEVKHALESHGHVFSSKADHEVLVHLFEDLDVNPLAFQNVQGAFSFAVWDSVKKKLMLGLDKLGMRALYFTFSNRNLLFASEIKGILGHPDVPKKVSSSSLDLFFSYFYVPTEDTLISGVKKIMPATYRIFSFDNGPAISSGFRYWQLDLSAKTETDTSSACVEIYSVLMKSVKEGIRDAPATVGVSLSGGLDSGVISTLLRRLDQKVVAFVVAIEGGEKNEARLTAEFNGSEIEEISVTEDDYIRNTGEIARILDEPVFEWSLVPMYMIGQRATGKVDILFTGDGGDETFWGYPWVPRRWFDPLLSIAPSSAKALANLLLNSRGISDQREKPLFRDFSPDVMCERISLPSSSVFFLDVLKKCNPNDLQDTGYVSNTRELASPIDACFKQVSINDDLLRRYYALLTINLVHGGAGIRSREAIYGYHGIKCAMPFMDERMVRLSYSIPSNLKQPSRFETKSIMKKTIVRHKLLPGKKTKLRKRALGDPLNTWRRFRMLKEFILSELEEGCRMGIIKKNFVDKAKMGVVSPGKCFGIVTYILWYKDLFMKG